VTPPPLPLSDPVASAIYAMTAKNMVGTPIETITTRNGLVTGATVQTYRFAGPSKSSLLPFQYFRLEAAQPLSQYTPTAYGSQAGSPLNIAGGSSQMQLKATFTQYDATGNPLGLVKGGVQNADYSVTGGATSSYLWGYQNSLPVAKVDNAAPNEVFHSNFEEDKMVATAAADVAGTWYSPGGYLKFETTPSDRPSTRSVAHTGRLAGAMYTGYNGEQAHAFSPTLTIAARPKSTKYVLSGWVYTNGPQASIWLFPNLPSARQPDGTVRYYDGFGNTSRPDLMPIRLMTTADQTGKWIYLEQEVAVPADATLLTFRLSNFWNGAGNAAATINGGGTWFDDVRIHPAGAQMTTYTHQPGVGVTSTSDANNRPTQYEYDGLNRLGVVRDSEGNILKQLEYHYQH